MNPEKALKTIFILSVTGLLFSGYLSYMELFAGGCKNAFIQCGSTFSLFQLPACVYGFFMYLIIFFVSLLGLRKKN
jgi:hypothetical protein